METKRVQALTIRINNNRELTVLEDKHRVILVKLSNKYSNLLQKAKKLLNTTCNQD